MSGTVKSGLLFSVIGLIAVVVVGFVPVIGPLLCGPGVALLVGALAGYFAVRWTAGPAGVGQGILAGTIAGVGALIGGIIFWVAVFSLFQNNPEFQSAFNQAFEQQMQRQPGATTLTPEEAQNLLNVFGPIAGVCFGVLNLVIALVGGLIGGLIGRRQVPTETYAPPTPPVPPAVPPVS